MSTIDDQEKYFRSGLRTENVFDNTETMMKEMNETSIESDDVMKKQKSKFKGIYYITGFYKWFMNLSFITRWLALWFPLACLLVIPLAVGASPKYRYAKLGTVRIFWVFLWFEIAWGGFWVSRLVAKFIPYSLYTIVGIFPFTAYKLSIIISAIELPLAFFFTCIIGICTFPPLMINNSAPVSYGSRNTTVTPSASGANNVNPNIDLANSFSIASNVQPWIKVCTKIIGAFVILSIVLLLEKTCLHFIGFHYHEVQYQFRIADNRKHLSMLTKLFLASMKAPYKDSPFVLQQDDILNLGASDSLIKEHTPRHIRQVKRITKNAKKAFRKTRVVVGTVFNNIVGHSRRPFTPEEEYIIEMLRSRKRSLAIARRIWYAIVPAGEDSFKKEDLAGLISDNDDIISIFEVLDRDYSRSISLDELEQFCREIADEFFSIRVSLRDVDVALSKLDRVGLAAVGIIGILIFVSFLDTSFATILAAYGTTLLSLSFIFATTAQELMSSIVFLFSKHPFDISDIVVINGTKYEVVTLSLLYTVFRTMSGSTVQAPNSLLNTLFIENLRRSLPQSESITLTAPFATDFKQLEHLRHLLLGFVKENDCDFRPLLDLSVQDFSALDSLKFTITFYYKSNWQNTALQAIRRNKFMCGLINAVRDVNLPAVGDPVRGSPDYPFVIEQFTKENLKPLSDHSIRPSFTDVSSTSSSPLLKRTPSASFTNNKTEKQESTPPGDERLKKEATAKSANSNTNAAPVGYIRQTLATWQVPELMNSLNALDRNQEISQEIRTTQGSQTFTADDQAENPEEVLATDEHSSSSDQ
ncbi:MS ion channel protein 2 [Schizosaccharomyces cryophilus OY26]|uniref:Mechanosensitive ion channel protein n=1 Tax=Schizosaccharomyces cryophilus (strain OY26 / ATCC MYA-4695 / CBS 11777 / NBRC 106824 / NRRL Y48691) TaxID=653667 RepID=S9W1S8_SCHCR|nr:MS ion channel protein 2 [Schizosaccharomyces cryophilus OY26]EPY51975.1 MS ion channel protein 2 [Schizosaccharomyces cryophilus OY26]